MPTRPLVAPVLLVLALAGAAPLSAQRLAPPRFSPGAADQIFRAPAAVMPRDTGEVADSAGGAVGAFLGATLLSGVGSFVGVYTGLLTAIALHIDGDENPGLVFVVVAPQTALLAGAGSCAAYHQSASCRPIFVASALGAVGGALVESALWDDYSAGAVVLSYAGIQTLAAVVAGAVARHAAAASREQALKAAP